MCSLHLPLRGLPKLARAAGPNMPTMQRSQSFAHAPDYADGQQSRQLEIRHDLVSCPPLLCAQLADCIRSFHQARHWSACFVCELQLDSVQCSETYAWTSSCATNKAIISELVSTGTASAAVHSATRSDSIVSAENLIGAGRVGIYTNLNNCEPVICS